MKKYIFILLLAVSFSSVSYAQDQEEYKKAVSTMFAVSGSEATFTAAIDQIFSIFKQQYPEISEDIWIELKKEFDMSSMDELITKMIPIYQKHLTLEDINAIIKFYKTPAGQKYAEKIPFITQESMQVGQEWGMEIGEAFTKRMAERGY